MKYENDKNENQDVDNENEDVKEAEVENEEILDIDNEELDRILKENEELTTRFQRLQADFVNYRKRVEKEKDGLIDYGIETLTLDILPILDNFERALEAEVNKDDPFFNGIEMIYDGLIGALNKNDIKEMRCLEKPFDPEYHHAVATEECEDYEKDKVIKILQKGYIMKDKVIRPSMVIVSK